jgi:hypothetical protein
MIGISGMLHCAVLSVSLISWSKFLVLKGYGSRIGSPVVWQPRHNEMVDRHLAQ